MFNDKEVDTKVKYKLGIFDGSEPNEYDLDNVKDIFISNYNARGEKINTNISELVRLKKLKMLDLKGFELTQEVLDVINSLQELQELKLCECNSKEPLNINIEKLKTIVLDNCSSIDLSQIQLPENLLMISCGIVDVSKLTNTKRLRDLGIKSSEVVNTSALTEIDNLKSVNFNGSTLDNENVLKDLKKGNVEVSYMYEDHPIQ